MICATCYGMLRGHVGRQWRGTWDIYFNYHKSEDRLKNAADMGCCFCVSTYYKLRHVRQNEPWNAKQQCLIRAHLDKVPRRNDLYRLDFRLSDRSRTLGTFLLEHTGTCPRLLKHLRGSEQLRCRGSVED